MPIFPNSVSKTGWLKSPGCRNGCSIGGIWTFRYLPINWPVVDITKVVLKNKSPSFSRIDDRIIILNFTASWNSKFVKLTVQWLRLVRIKYLQLNFVYLSHDIWRSPSFKIFCKIFPWYSVGCVEWVRHIWNIFRTSNMSMQVKTVYLTPQFR